ACGSLTLPIHIHLENNLIQLVQLQIYLSFLKKRLIPLSVTNQNNVLPQLEECVSNCRYYPRTTSVQNNVQVASLKGNPKFK
ncbi:oxidoreductase YteT, partial [Biomphalaria glabrata]